MNLRKVVSLLALSALIGGSALAVQGCFEETVPAYGYGGPAYGYSATPAYGYRAPYYPYGPATVGPQAVYGDWDEDHEWLARPAHHEWHDRD